jgi:hypothetical protein
MRILIATACRPMTEAKCFAFNESLREGAAKEGMFIPQGIWWTHGHYCANLAFDLLHGTDEQNETFGRSLTMGLQPAKWCETSDALPKKDQWDFEDEEPADVS